VGQKEGAAGGLKRRRFGVSTLAEAGMTALLAGRLPRGGGEREGQAMGLQDGEMRGEE